jgi:hypothetical protein
MNQIITDAFIAEIEKIAAADRFFPDLPDTPEQIKLLSRAREHRKKRTRRARAGGVASGAGLLAIVGALARKSKRLGIIGAGSTAAGAALLSSAGKHDRKRREINAKRTAIDAKRSPEYYPDGHYSPLPEKGRP